MSKEILILIFLVIALPVGILLYKNYKKSFEPTIFYIVRHGQTDWNAEKKIQGHRDIPLNDTGRKQAREVGEKLASIPLTAYYSSDLQRAYETAQIIVNSKNIEIRMDNRLKERNFGPWEGHSSVEFFKGPDETRQNIESDQEMKKRIFESLDEIAKRHPGENILIVAHGGVIRNIIVSIFAQGLSGFEIETKNGSILQLIFSNGEWSIKDLSGVTLPSL